MSATNPAVAELLALEQERTQAMLRKDWARLREILHPGLVHVHAKGQVDSYASYFEAQGVTVDYQRIERSDLAVQVFGNSALMTGQQFLVAVRLNGSGTVTIDSRVMQMWVRDSTEHPWRQVAFQTTPTSMSVV